MPMSVGAVPGRSGTLSGTKCSQAGRTTRIGMKTQKPIANNFSTPTGTVSFTVTASDPDNDPITFSLVSAPAGAFINPTSGVFTFRPDNGPYTFTLTVKAADPSGAYDTQSL